MILGNIVAGSLMIGSAIGMFIFLRWICTPNREMQQRAKEFKEKWDEAHRGDYPSDEEQTPIYDQRKEPTLKEFREGKTRHRLREFSLGGKRPPPPPPPMVQGDGKRIPLKGYGSSSDDHYGLTQRVFLGSLVDTNSSCSSSSSGSSDSCSSSSSSSSGSSD